MKTKDLLNTRNIWLGCAMLWIILYHSKLRLPPIEALTQIKAIGYGGVDICLFASGLGCYFSLSKNSDIFEFEKRRLARLMPTYWVFMVFWCIFKVFTANIKFPAILGNVLGIQKFTCTGNAFNWYITAILMLYIFAPFMKELVDRYSSFIKQFLIVLFFIVFSIPFWTSGNFIIVITRIPIFYMGLLFGKYCKNNPVISCKVTIPCIIGSVIGFVLMFTALVQWKKYLWSYGLYWYPFILITPGLCMLISYITVAIKKVKFLSWIINFIALVGKYSFEVYLVHILLFDIVDVLIKDHILPNRNLVHFFAIISIAIGCAILKLLTTAVTKLFTINKGRRKEIPQA